VILQSMGLGYLFQKEEEITLKGRVRALLRNVVAERAGLRTVVAGK